MVIDRGSGRITHDVFSHIAEYLPARSVLVVNNSKVIPARLLGRKSRSGGKIEIFLLKKRADGYTFDVLLKPLQRIRSGEEVVFDGTRITAVVTDPAGGTVRFSRKDIDAQLSGWGHMPLPPYIKRTDRPSDQRAYQTVYARHPGSVAAPTAGLHFTTPLMRKLRSLGHDILAVSLHINYATFKPVVEEDITRHQMYQEDYAVPQATARAILQARAEGRKIVAVGTTSCRALESWARTGLCRGSTDLFIYPGYAFRMVDALITNFHQSHSTLLMLVSAFASLPTIQKAYRQAQRKGYRFLSYGDAMLVR